MGISGLPLRFLYRSQVRNEIESENVATYLARYNGAIRFDRAEIDKVRFWSAAEIEAALGRGVFTPNFEEEWGMFRRWCSGEDT